jgi:hypothetical protein
MNKKGRDDAMILILDAGADGAGGTGTDWNDAKQEELGRWAAEFKAQGDMAGVHLCAVVDEEIKKLKAAGGGCPVTHVFYLALIISRRANGADHQLAHLLLPQIQELMAKAFHEAEIEQRKREAGIG